MNIVRKGLKMNTIKQRLGRNLMTGGHARVAGPVLCALAFAFGSASADEVYWGSLLGGDYENGANWVGGQPPAGTDNAWFTSNGVYTVAVNADATVAQATFAASTDAQVVIDLNGRRWENAKLVVGPSGTTGNQLTLTGGVVVSTQGSSTTASGVLGATGTTGGNRIGVTDAIWTNTWHVAVLGKDNTLSIGANGLLAINDKASFAGINNLVEIRDGGEMHIRKTLYFGSTSLQGNRLVVDGTGSTLRAGTTSAEGVTIGMSTDGQTATVSGGARVQGSGFVRIAGGTGGSHEATVVGAGSVIEAPKFQVGYHGGHDSVVQISDGGMVSNTTGYVGYDAEITKSMANDNTVIVDEGGLWWLQQNVYLGQYGSGNHIVVTNGGTLSFLEYLYVGQGGQSNIVLVTDGGVLDHRLLNYTGWPLGYDVSNTGNRIMNVGGIYQFSLSNPDQLGMTIGEFGSFSIENGTLSFRATAGANVHCGESGQRFDSATILAWLGNNTFRLNNASNTLAASQTYTFTTNSGPAHFAGLDLYNRSNYRNGDVTLGDGGALTVSGGSSAVLGGLAFEPGGRMVVALGDGTNPGHLAVGAGATLGGATLDLTATVEPPLGQRFTLLTAAGGVDGEFVNGGVEIRSPGRIWYLSLTYDATHVYATHVKRGTVIAIR